MLNGLSWKRGALQLQPMKIIVTVSRLGSSCVYNSYPLIAYDPPIP